MNIGKGLRALGVAAVAGLVGTSAAYAGVTSLGFASTDSLEDTGVTFSGTLTYDDVAQLVTVELSNTSSFQSVITGFYFNIDGNASASYNAADNGTSGVLESAFAFSNSLAPFGTFDAGAVLTNLSQQQVRGIDEGETGIFTFSLSGDDAGSLSATSFLSQANSGGGISGPFAVRYQSVGDNAALSDKLVGVGDAGDPPVVVPLPPAAWAALATMGFGGLAKFRRRFRPAV